MRNMERGQAMAETALFATLAILMVWIPSHCARTAAPAAAYVGAQEITVLPDDTLTATRAGDEIASRYFHAQRLETARLTFVSCGRHQGRPACLVTAEVQSAGILLPTRWVRARHRLSGAQCHPRRSMKT
jgi:hypothetical protein